MTADVARHRRWSLGAAGWLLPLGLNVVWLVATLLIFGIRHEENDDMMISMLTSRAYGGVNLESVAFSHPLYLGLLSLLQDVFGFANWNTVLQLAGTCVALTVLTKVWWQRAETGLDRLVLVAVLSAVAAQYYLMLQFMRTASLWIIVGIVLLLIGLRLGQRTPMIIGGVLVTAGSVLRFDSLLLMGLFGLVLVVYEQLRLPAAQRRAWWRRALVSGGVLLALVGALRGAPIVFPSSPEVAEYRASAAARAELLDAGMVPYQADPQGYAALGLTELDVHVFRTWTFADPDVFGLDTLEGMVALKKGHGAASKSASAVVSRAGGWVTAFNLSQIRPALQFKVLLLGLIVATVALRRRGWWLLLAATLAAVGVGYLLAAYNARLVPRYEASLLLGAVITVAYGLVGWPGETVPRGPALASLTRQQLGLFTALVAILPWLLVALTLQRPTPTQHAAFFDVTRANNALYLIDVRTVMAFHRSYDPLRPLRPDEFSHVFILGGWQGGSAPSEAVLRRWGLRNPLPDAVGRHDVVLVDNTAAEQKLQYVRSHYRPDANLVRIGVLHGYAVYRFAA